MLSMCLYASIARDSNSLSRWVGDMVLNVKATLWVGRCSQLCSSIAGIRVGFRWDVDCWFASCIYSDDVGWMKFMGGCLNDHSAVKSWISSLCGNLKLGMPWLMLRWLLIVSLSVASYRVMVWCLDALLLLRLTVQLRCIGGTVGHGSPKLLCQSVLLHMMRRYIVKFPV